jgi:hypothetical protein
MNGPCAFDLKGLVRMKRKWDGRLVHVDDVTWIFSCNLHLDECNEVLRLYLRFEEVFLSGMRSRANGQPEPLREA